MKALSLMFIILLAVALSATPRGLTSREIAVEDAVAGIQPRTMFPPLVSETETAANPFSKDWIPVLEQPLNMMLPAGEQYGVYFRGLDSGAELFSSLGELLPQSETAVGRAPYWIRVELRNTLNQLTPAKQLLYADLINTVQDPYVDEVAFCVAISSPEYLNSAFALPELFVENAVWIYSIASELPYVEVVDTGNSSMQGNYWSTTRYWKKDASGQLVQVTVPRDIYYWYLVNPKITDEIAAYIDPAIVENNSTHSNNIVPPPTGKFWRSYIYDYEQTDFPVLSDTLSLCQSVFNRDGTPGDAIHAVIRWINQNMSFTSNNERPHQPVRIFAKRFGRCGEYADFTSAICRIALIPCTNISSISTDHTWNEFWEDGWVSTEPVNGYLNSPLVYENGWGKVFGTVFEERSDGLFTPVTERYSEGLATINIQVVDQNLQPVDAARVILAIFETAPRFDCEAYTDNNGMVSFQVGENRDYRARAETYFGLYPANPGTYTQLVSSSVDGETYNYQFQIAAALPVPAIEALAPPADPVLDYQVSAVFQSPGYYITGRALWDDIDGLGSQPRHYSKVDTPANVAWMATDSDNLLFLQLENFCSAYDLVGPAAGGYHEFNIPAGQDWYSFADNSHRHGNAALVSGLLMFLTWVSASDDPQAPDALTRLSAPAPNPFSGSVRLSLNLSARADVGVEVFNLRGQRVRSISVGTLQSGVHELVWDGLDDSGADLASGVYLLKVGGGGRSLVRKVMLLK